MSSVTKRGVKGLCTKGLGFVAVLENEKTRPCFGRDGPFLWWIPVEVVSETSMQYDLILFNGVVVDVSEFGRWPR